MKNRKKWKVIAPLAGAAVGSLAAGVAVLVRKLPKPEAPVNGPAPVKPVKLESGSYSFISGFKDAETVELTLDYDPEKYSFVVVEDGFLCDTGDSHVAILCGEDFDLQLEYATYYSGEDFAAHCKTLGEKYEKVSPVNCGALTGVWVQDGDNVVMHFPIPGDACSYLLVIAQKNPAFKDEVTALPEYPPLKELLGTIRFTRS